MGHMRLVTWNCNGALNRKFDALMALGPDVAVVQECAAPEKLRSQMRDRIGSLEWVGRLPTKGIAARLSDHAPIVVEFDL